MGDLDSSAAPPQVFVSYSHDSPQHKQWVAEFATRLRKEGGSDVVLDQWDTEHGDDLVKFMERSVRDADRVLMICTTSYVKKANDGKGGVGYEAMVVTGEMVRDLGTAKFIPIIPPENAGALVPICVSTRRYVDLRNEASEQQGFDELVSTLHHIPARTKPPIGLAERFRVVEYAVQVAGERDCKDTKGDTPSFPLEFYARATSIIKRDDYLDWQRLVRETRRMCTSNLLEFRKAQEVNFAIASHDEARDMVTEAASLFAPLMVIALAGVESASERFRNQGAVISDILNPGGWIRSESSILVDLPKALAFIFQALMGAMCIQSRQFDLAIDLAQTTVGISRNGEAEPLYTQFNITGWIHSLGGSFIQCSHFLLTMPKRWIWLDELFENSDNFGACVSCYYICMLIIELSIASKSGTTLMPDASNFNVPPLFWLASSETSQNALLKLHRDKQQIIATLNAMEVNLNGIASAWDSYASAWSKTDVAFQYDLRHQMKILRNPIRSII